MGNQVLLRKLRADAVRSRECTVPPLCCEAVSARVRKTAEKSDTEVCVHPCRKAVR